MPKVIPPKDELLDNLREQYDDSGDEYPYLAQLLKEHPPKPKKDINKPIKMKYESIQWVIDLLGQPLVPDRKTHENHKMDSFRADEKISWCPKCSCKWNLYEGRTWKSKDMRLWKEKICPDCDSPVK